MRKTLRAIGWIAAGLAGLCTVLYLVALAINWRDEEPNAAAVRLSEIFCDRPAVADQDNGYVYLQRWALDPNRVRIARVQELIGACRPGHEACARAFDAADGLFDDWHAAEDSLLDTYLAFVAHTGWREEISFSFAEAIAPYSGAMDGERLLLVRARELAKRGDVAAASFLLEHDLQFWRKVLESSDILISKMIATAALNRHFEWGYRVLRQVPAREIDAAIPQGWRNGLSDAERSMVRCFSAASKPASAASTASTTDATTSASRTSP